MNTVVDLIPDKSVITPQNPVITVHMTKEQYEEMVAGNELLRRNRERARQAYYDKKPNAKKSRPELVLPQSPVNTNNIPSLYPTIPSLYPSIPPPSYPIIPSQSYPTIPSQSVQPKQLQLIITK